MLLATASPCSLCLTLGWADALLRGWPAKLGGSRGADSGFVCPSVALLLSVDMLTGLCVSGAVATDVPDGKSCSPSVSDWFAEGGSSSMMAEVVQGGIRAEERGSARERGGGRARPLK